ncbi:hypothetical protein AAY473_035002 [Plecturocebus cupreus]
MPIVPATWKAEAGESLEPKEVEAVRGLFIVASAHFPAVPGMWMRHRLSMQKRAQAPRWEDGETQAEKGSDLPTVTQPTAVNTVQYLRKLWQAGSCT